jgi:alpha-tubulin suppressor-like RCC1 family protein
MAVKQEIAMRLLAAVLVFGLGLASLPTANAQDRDSVAAKAVANPRLIRMAAGSYHTCALTETGRVKCWGDNTRGQLGDGTQMDRLTAVPVLSLAGGLKSVTAGATHTCVLTSSGGIKCWGRGITGALGDGVGLDRYTPAFVSGLSSGAIAVSAGGDHTCAITKPGGVKCWGWNASGQLGDGTKTLRLAPVSVKGFSGKVIALSAGLNYTCAVEDTGRVRCWGGNINRQLGDGTTEERLIPVAVAGLRGVAAVSASMIATHTCALTTGGAAFCWGSNRAGQLGDGTEEERTEPVPVVGLAGSVRAIATGNEFTCALLSSGKAQCWGANLGAATLGNDGLQENYLTPVFVKYLDGTSIASGVSHSCAHRKSGGAACWGLNLDGQLGNGDTSLRKVPVRVKRF